MIDLAGVNTSSDEAEDTLGEASPISSPTGTGTTAAGPPAARHGRHPSRAKDAELYQLLERVRQCDDARIAIFLRAGHALLDGLQDSNAAHPYAAHPYAAHPSANLPSAAAARHTNAVRSTSRPRGA